VETRAQRLETAHRQDAEVIVTTIDDLNVHQGTIVGLTRDVFTIKDARTGDDKSFRYQGTTVVFDDIEDVPTGFPKGAPRPSDEEALVALLVPEKIVREIEKQFLAPRGLELAGPLLFQEDDLPSYIIGISS
jgi:hypothetical protein